MNVFIGLQVQALSNGIFTDFESLFIPCQIGLNRARRHFQINQNEVAVYYMHSHSNTGCMNICAKTQKIYEISLSRYLYAKAYMHGNKRASAFWYQASKMRDGKGKTQTYTRTHQANRTVSIPVFESRDSRIKVSNHICSIAIHAHLYCLYKYIYVSLVIKLFFLYIHSESDAFNTERVVYCYFCWAKVWRIWKLKSLNKSIKTTLLSTIPYVHWNLNVKMNKKNRKTMNKPFCQHCHSGRSAELWNFNAFI